MLMCIYASSGVHGSLCSRVVKGVTLQSTRAAQEGTWNKVGMLRKIMEDTPPERAEWIVYMQPETFFDDTTFAIPFDSYRDKDLVLIGNQTALRDGKMRGAQASRCAQHCCIMTVCPHVLVQDSSGGAFPVSMRDMF